MLAAINTLRAERDALITLFDAIDEGFDAACTTIRGLPGKLVVTGMGKSGCIGNKISATLRSTGQPSAFLDPAQALHGDMGMLAFGDGLLAISNSGETTECVAVARYCRARDIPVIVITSRAICPLVNLALHTILYPLMPEGCPIERAPMASTIMQLALGDAIASELMEARGFTAADFLALHHGGYLGRAIAAS